VEFLFIAMWATPVFLCFYFYFHFLIEEDLLFALRSGGLRLVANRSKLASVEHLPVFAITCALIWFFVGSSFQPLQKACLDQLECERFLKSALPTLRPFGTLVDDADIQWRQFRESLPLLTIAAVALTGIVRYVPERLVPGPATESDTCRAAMSRCHMASQLRLLIGLVFVLYLHGVGAFFVLGLVVVFFTVAQVLAGTRLLVPLSWILAISAIAAKESHLPVRQYLTFRTVFGSGFAYLDGTDWHGKYNWSNSINFVVLRLLSFSLDQHRAVKKAEDKHGGQSSFSLRLCLTYVLYAPLWLAGPTICFDDFAAQSRRWRRRSGSLGWYLGQLFFAIFALECFTTVLPVFALSRSGVMSQLDPRLGFLGTFLLLNVMWLKFTVIWRFSRAWAMMDGIDPPENMTRAFCNHYSVQSFWKGWHVSYNKWLTRYIYVPCGGRDNRKFAMTITFVFVAFWHDVEAKLLMWGLGNALFIALEETVSRHLRARIQHAKLQERRPRLHFFLWGLGGALCIQMLVLVNLIGYGIGLNGASAFLALSAKDCWNALIGFISMSALYLDGVVYMVQLRFIDGTFGQNAVARSLFHAPT